MYDARRAVGPQRGGGLGLGLGLRPKQQAGIRSAVNTGTLNEYLTGGGGRPKLMAKLSGLAGQGQANPQASRMNMYRQVNAMNQTAAAPPPAAPPPTPMAGGMKSTGNALYDLADSMYGGGDGEETAQIGGPSMDGPGGLTTPGGPPATLGMPMQQMGAALQQPGLRPMPMPGRGMAVNRMQMQRTPMRRF